MPRDFDGDLVMDLIVIRKSMGSFTLGAVKSWRRSGQNPMGLGYFADIRGWIFHEYQGSVYLANAGDSEAFPYVPGLGWAYIHAGAFPLNRKSILIGNGCCRIDGSTYSMAANPAVQCADGTGGRGVICEQVVLRPVNLLGQERFHLFEGRFEGADGSLPEIGLGEVYP